MGAEITNIQTDLKFLKKVIIEIRERMINIDLILNENMREDIEFAKRTEEAWKSYERGEFKERDFDDFIKEMKTW